MKERTRLTLKRYAGESIRIGSDVVVSVVKKKGGALVLAVQAPPSVNIVRTEFELQEAK